MNACENVHMHLCIHFDNTISNIANMIIMFTIIDDYVSHSKNYKTYRYLQVNTDTTVCRRSGWMTIYIYI